MTLQNRVLPTGEIVADPARGLFTGNRGALTLDNGRLGTSRWKHQHWIICDLHHPRGTYRGPTPDHGWMPLFFLDEASALSAGHRPCAYCRPQAYASFKSAWTKAHGAMSHTEIDRKLHGDRVTSARAQIHHQSDCALLPNGTFLLHQDAPHLLWDTHLLRFTPGGYTAHTPRPTGPVTVLTPAATVAALTAGYIPVLHPTAQSFL